MHDSFEHYWYAVTPCIGVTLLSYDGGIPIQVGNVSAYYICVVYKCYICFICCIWGWCLCIIYVRCVINVLYVLSILTIISIGFVDVFDLFGSICDSASISNAAEISTCWIYPWSLCILFRFVCVYCF